MLCELGAPRAKTIILFSSSHPQLGQKLGSPLVSIEINRRREIKDVAHVLLVVSNLLNNLMLSFLNACLKEICTQKRFTNFPRNAYFTQVVDSSYTVERVVKYKDPDTLTAMGTIMYTKPFTS